MRWYVKCFRDNVKGLIPGHTALRKFKRKACGYNAPAARADFAITEGLRMIGFIRSLRPIEGARCLEVGAGWEPLLPVLFSLAGARSVVMTDLHRLCDDETFDIAMRNLRRNEAVICQSLELSAEKRSALLDAGNGMSLQEGLRRFHIEYAAPCDCSRLPMPDGSIDLVYSRDTLEHVPSSVMAAIFRDLKRVLAPGGLACHLIDPSDHWEHGDKQISRINFLRYSDPIFRLTHLNGLNYHNRLRHSEYVSLLVDSGFEILKEERVVDPKALAMLPQFKLAKRYRSYDAKDLATVDSLFLVQPAGSGRTR